ncbi:Hypothetical predicted protein [Paramuricea clavata]|uniref:Uncharacterized protein n=1 Tax=Paramuricea clavata TaxID=317549 RepID=A0A7D9DVX7_PARCT|nr:Hypothetical predicted protein [Paramuricea clavata]
MTNIADSVFETETAEISPVKTCEIITNNNPAVTESTPLKHLSLSYNTFTNDMKGVKADITVIQKQITSINNVINSTNAIIESISKVLDSTENRQISYDTRMETLLKEFSIILDEKNRAINERDITIKQLQANLSEIENDRNSLNLKNSPTKHVDNKSKTASPPMQPLMCQMNNIEDLINLSKINDLCDIEIDVLGDASKSDDMLLNACAISSRLSPGTTAYVDDSDEYAISTANADACAVPSDSPPEKSAHADDTSAPISQQCGEDNSGEYDETLNRTDNIVNPERTKKLVKPAIMCNSKSTICQQKMYGKSPLQDRTMPQDWLNYLPFVETGQEENVNSNVSMQLDYNLTRENPVETLPLTKMSPRTSSHNNTNVIPDEVLHTPIALLGADSSNVCMEDQLKAYRRKHQTVNRIKQCPNPMQPKKVTFFKEQSKPYCGRVNKTRFQTEYNQAFFREGNAYRHTND